MQPMLYARPLLSKKVGGEEKCLEIINVTEHDQMFIFSGEEEGGEENCFILLPGGGDHCQTQRKGGGNITNTNTNRPSEKEEVIFYQLAEFCVCFVQKVVSVFSFRHLKFHFRATQNCINWQIDKFK